MRILVLGDDRPDFAAIESAFRRGEVDVLPARSALVPASPERACFAFAGWTL